MSIKEIIDKGRWATEEAWYKGNVDALDEVYAHNLIYHRYPFPDVNGLEAFKQRILTTRQAYENIRIDWEETICEANTIAMRYTMRIKHTGVSPSFPVPPTGKDLVLKGSAFLQVKNDKIFEHFEYNDYFGLLQQLGVAPQLGA